MMRELLLLLRPWQPRSTMSRACPAYDVCMDRVTMNARWTGVPVRQRERAEAMQAGGGFGGAGFGGDGGGWAGVGKTEGAG